MILKNLLNLVRVSSLDIHVWKVHGSNLQGLVGSSRFTKFLVPPDISLKENFSGVYFVEVLKFLLLKISSILCNLVC